MTFVWSGLKAAIKTTMYKEKTVCMYIYIYIKYFISYEINNTKKQMSNCKFNFAFLIIKYKYIYIF